MGILKIQVIFCGFILQLSGEAALALSWQGWNQCSDRLKCGLQRASSLCLTWMKISPYFYSIYVLGYSGNQRVKQTLKLTHHVPERLISQGAGCTESGVFFPQEKHLSDTLWVTTSLKNAILLPYVKDSLTNQRFLGYTAFLLSSLDATPLCFTNTAKARKRAFSRQRPSCSLELQHSLLFDLIPFNKATE